MKTSEVISSLVSKLAYKGDLEVKISLFLGNKLIETKDIEVIFSEEDDGVFVLITELEPERPT